MTVLLCREISSCFVWYHCEAGAFFKMFSGIPDDVSPEQKESSFRSGVLVKTKPACFPVDKSPNLKQPLYNFVVMHSQKSRSGPLDGFFFAETILCFQFEPFKTKNMTRKTPRRVWLFRIGLWCYSALVSSQLLFPSGVTAVSKLDSTNVLCLLSDKTWTQTCSLITIVCLISSDINFNSN